jgi:hypothetical protein
MKNRPVMMMAMSAFVLATVPATPATDAADGAWDSCSGLAPVVTECTTGRHSVQGSTRWEVDLPPCLAHLPEGGACYVGDVRMVLDFGPHGEKVKTCNVIALPGVPPDVQCVVSGVGVVFLTGIHRCTSHFTTYMYDALGQRGGAGPWGCRID